MDFLAIHRKDDIPFPQSGLMRSTVCFGNSHQYAAFISRRDRHERINVSVPAQAYSQTA